jgi:hypothetical protein
LPLRSGRAGDNDAVVVNQNGDDKAERLDAVGNLTDLLARMGASVPPVRGELVDRNPANINHRLSLRGRYSERERALTGARYRDLQFVGLLSPAFRGRDHSRPLL